MWLMIEISGIESAHHDFENLFDYFLWTVKKVIFHEKLFCVVLLTSQLARIIHFLYILVIILA